MECINVDILDVMIIITLGCSKEWDMFVTSTYAVARCQFITF